MIDAEEWTLEAQWVRCGKHRCKTCPHGPYWYGFQHKGGKMKSKYLGRLAPWEREGFLSRADAERLRMTMRPLALDEQIARQILSVSPRAAEHGCYLAAVALLLAIDERGSKGGSADRIRIRAAFNWLRTVHRWKRRLPRRV